MIVCAANHQKSHSFAKSAIKIRTSGGISGRFICQVCRACDEECSCASACSSGALLPRKGGGVTLIADKCIGCKECINACIVNAIFFDTVANKPIICKHCGLCARFCPHQCLEYRRTE